ncbi:MAG: hypothetical protein M3387_10930 [Actinomycetota bacterium]|nr:hypothetical protein [Actinomycetota bacterium]
MVDTITIRIDRTTHQELKRLARKQHATVSDTVARAVRVLRQAQIGGELAGGLVEDGTAWLDAASG